MYIQKNCIAQKIFVLIEIETLVLKIQLFFCLNILAFLVGFRGKVILQ